MVRSVPNAARSASSASGATLWRTGTAGATGMSASTGAEVLGIDWRIDPREAIERVGDRVALQGNLDPCTLFAPPDVVRAEAQRVLDGFKDQRGYIFNLGHGILPKTPPENAVQVVQTIRDYCAAR